ncbi:MAG TPA: 50S ribosomal protein L29 [Gammaproteobacteria bacterium]|nr:50S ribosomal protein L29 [Gammaproteobacteria bacterium]
MASKAEEIRKLGEEGLQNRLRDLRDEEFNLRFQHSTGQLENTARLREVRREIARVKTVMNEQVEAAE